MMRGKGHIHPSGSALMMVLLVTGVLSTLIFSTLMVVNRNLERAREGASEMEALALAQKGIAVGVYGGIRRDDPLLNFSSEDGSERYVVSIESEGIRANINGITQRGDKSFLRALFYEWGLEDDEADKVADALVDWVDRDDEVELNGAEKLAYEELGFFDRPYNRPFSAVEDMQLVLGFDRVVEEKPNWREYFTVYGDTVMDIHEVGAELLSIAAGVDVAEAEIFAANVLGEDGMMGTEDDVRHESVDAALDALGVSADEGIREPIRQRFSSNSQYRRVQSTGYYYDTEATITMVIFQRGAGAAPSISYQSHP